VYGQVWMHADVPGVPQAAHPRPAMHACAGEQAASVAQPDAVCTAEVSIQISCAVAHWLPQWGKHSPLPPQVVPQVACSAGPGGQNGGRRVVVVVVVVLVIVVLVVVVEVVVLVVVVEVVVLVIVVLVVVVEVVVLVIVVLVVVVEVVVLVDVVVVVADGFLRD